MLTANEFKRQCDESKAIKEIFEEISSWIPDLHAMLEDPDSVCAEKDYAEFRGSLKALRNVLSVRGVMYENKLANEQGDDNG